MRLDARKGTPSLLRVRGATKRFPGVVALDGVDLELRPGEVHALVGENGSGKSTLAKLVYGALEPDAGVVEVDGSPVTFTGPRKALERGIIGISQELTLAPTLTVTENILLGRMPRRRCRAINWRRARALAREALGQLSIDVDETRRVGDLSVEVQQEVEIARAVSAESRVLVFDEATSSLSEAAARRLLRKIDQLRRQGVAILMISHRLPEVYTSASVATILRDGRRVGVVQLPETPEGELVRMMVGRDIRDLYGRREISHGTPLLQVENLSTDDGALKPTSFEVHSGEILGVAGLVGSGKADLGLALAGAVPSDGAVRIRGRSVKRAGPRDALASGIGFVPDDRKRSALLPTRSVAHNLSSAWGRRLSRWGVALDLQTENRMVDEAIRRFNVTTPSPSTPIRSLSGGNQQKVVLGRWFTLDLDVLVLSEPTRGIDVGAKSEVYRFIQEVAERGSAVVMISSELPELLGVAHRIAVMFQGEVRAQFDPRTSSEEEVANVAIGGGAGRGPGSERRGSR